MVSNRPPLNAQGAEPLVHSEATTYLVSRASEGELASSAIVTLHELRRLTEEIGGNIDVDEPPRKHKTSPKSADAKEIGR